MKLGTYLEFKQIPVVQAASQLKIKRQYLYAILKDGKKPGRKLAMRIKEWSDNAVDYGDLWE